MDKNTLEYKIAIVYIYATSADAGDITEKEMNQLISDLASVFKTLNINIDADNYLSDCFEDFNNMDETETTEVVTSSIISLGELLSIDNLKIVYNGIADVVNADSLASEEKEVLKTLEKTWGLE